MLIENKKLKRDIEDIEHNSQKLSKQVSDGERKISMSIKLLEVNKNCLFVCLFEFNDAPTLMGH